MGKKGERVAIIGGGVGGLCVARCLLEAGHQNFVLFEASEGPLSPPFLFLCCVAFFVFLTVSVRFWGGVEPKQPSLKHL